MCGAHQGETDTIIIVNIDRKARRIAFVSLPRDLFYKGRKINAVYRDYGPAELAREVGQITGLELSNYLVIDMYAFIDVVNILGGIDVYLDRPLADPSYRVRNSGRWSTLSYPAGMHHLDGIETLRIARSRHTTSDFARSYRQQEILAAIYKKLARTDIFDIAKLYRLSETFLRYVDTNFTPAQLVDLALSARGIPITGRYVVDTANVLYQTYTKLYYLNESEKEISDHSDLGAWIVLPKNDDWNIIRHYVHSLLRGEAS